MQNISPFTSFVLFREQDVFFYNQNFPHFLKKFVTVFKILSTPRQNNRVLPNFEALKQTILLRMLFLSRILSSILTRKQALEKGYSTILPLCISGKSSKLEHFLSCFSSVQGDTHKGKNAAIYNKLSEEKMEISFQYSISQFLF